MKKLLVALTVDVALTIPVLHAASKDTSAAQVWSVSLDETFA